MTGESELRTLAEVMGVEDERLSRMAEVAWDLYRQHRFREAASVFRGLTALDPERVDLYRGLALAASRDNDLLTAADALERADVLLEQKGGRDGDRGYLLALLAAVLYRSTRRKEALARAQQSLSLSPPDAHWVAPLQQGIERAEATLLRAPAKSPAETQTLRRALRARLADVGKGHQTLARALGYQDHELIRVFDDGAALLDAGQPRRAGRVFEGLVELDGGVPLFHLALAQAREIGGHHRDAARAFDDAVRTAREVPDGGAVVADALLRRAAHRFKCGKRRGCRADVEAAIALPAVESDPELSARAKKILRSLEGAVSQEGGPQGSGPGTLRRRGIR